MGQATNAEGAKMTEEQKRLEVAAQRVRDADARRRKILCTSPMDYDAHWAATYEANQLMKAYERLEDNMDPNGYHEDHQRPRP